MNSPDPFSSEVKRLLDRLDQRVAPTPGERDALRSKMWRDFEAAAWVDVEPEPEVPGEVITLTTEPVAEPSRTTQRLLLVAVAAAVVVLAFVGLSLPPRNDQPARVVEGPPFEIAGVSLDFTPEQTIVKATEQNDVLRITNRVPVFAAADGADVDTVTVGRPTSLFSGLTPEDFFAQNGISVTSALTSPFQDGEATLWTVSISDVEALRRGCGLGEPCIEFAQFNYGDDRLMLFAGVGNDIDLISLGEGDEPLLVFAKNRSGRMDRFLILDDLRVTEN
jgi:hypothetical protein